MVINTVSVYTVGTYIKQLVLSVFCRNFFNRIILQFYVLKVHIHVYMCTRMYVCMCVCVCVCVCMCVCVYVCMYVCMYVCVAIV